MSQTQFKTTRQYGLFEVHNRDGAPFRNREVDLSPTRLRLDRSRRHVEQNRATSLDRIGERCRPFRARCDALVVPKIDAMLTQPGHFGKDNPGVFVGVAHEDIRAITLISWERFVHTPAPTPVELIWSAIVYRATLDRNGHEHTVADSTELERSKRSVSV